jgi:hypothetical protein
MRTLKFDLIVLWLRIKRLYCYFFGHDLTNIVSPPIMSDKKKCSRCHEVMW